MNKTTSTPSCSRLQRWKWPLIRCGFVIGIFYFLYRTGQINLSVLKLAITQPGYYFLATFLMLTGVIIAVQRWRVLLAGQQFSLPMWTATKLSFVGFFFSTALPGSVSGDIVKAYYIAKGQEQKEALITTVIFDRLLGLYSMVLTAFLAVLFVIAQAEIFGQEGVWRQPAVKVAGFSVILCFLTLTVMAILFMHPRLRQSRLIVYILTKMPFHTIITKVYDAVHNYGRNLKLTFNALMLSVISQGFLFGGTWILCLLIDIHIDSFVNYLFIFPIGFLINAIPLAPGGLGIGEAGFQGIFLLFGSDRGAELALLFHAVFFFYAILVGGATYLSFNAAEMKNSIVAIKD